MKMNKSGRFALSISTDRTDYSSVGADKRNISLQNIKKIADRFSISELVEKVERLENKYADIGGM